MRLLPAEKIQQMEIVPFADSIKPSLKAIHRKFALAHRLQRCQVAGGDFTLSRVDILRNGSLTTSAACLSQPPGCAQTGAEGLRHRGHNGRVPGTRSL